MNTVSHFLSRFHDTTYDKIVQAKHFLFLNAAAHTDLPLIWGIFDIEYTQAQRGIGQMS